MGARQEESLGVRAGTIRRLSLRAALLIGIPTIATAILLGLPWPDLDRFMSDPAGTRILDRNGTYLSAIPGSDDSFQLKEAPEEIPPECAEMFTRLEDARFRYHPGVDPLALARAVAFRLTGRAQSGASTITMQLARLVVPHNRTFGGKVGEACNALRIESRLTKDRILGLYLDAIPFGRNTRGVGAAAWTYFAADLSALSRAQLLVLAIIPRNPTAYDPFDQPGRIIAAAEEADAGKGLGIGASQIEAAVRSAATGRPETDAPHFSRFIAQKLREGSIDAPSGRLVTSLDLGLNRFIQSRVSELLGRYEKARVTNAAVVAIDNATGEVIGWVGSRNFSDSAHAGQIDGALIRRQSASTLKPFLYARAIEKGWTAATLLPDVPLSFGTADEETYRPQNFDKRSHGVVRLRTALASSLNVPAVYTLSRVGVPDFLETLRGLGFSLPGDAAERYGLGAAVGNVEVSPLELARAFSVFPRGGLLPDLVFQRGGSRTSQRVFDEFAAWMICSILSDPSARATGFGTRTYFQIGSPSMFKSGTSSEFTNLWCVGATPAYTVAAWAGNFDGRSVINKTGSIVPTQIVADVLKRLSDGLPNGSGDFSAPTSVVKARICSVSGLAATDSCPSTRTEYFRSSAEVPGVCEYHAISGSKESLLQASFLAKGATVKILFPVPGQVFYRDQTRGSASQAIPVVIAARQGEQARVFLDGRRIAAGTALTEISLPLAAGSHSLLVSVGSGSDRVPFSVK